MYWCGLSSLLRIGQTDDSPQSLPLSGARRHARRHAFSFLLVCSVLLNACAIPSPPRRGDLATSTFDDSQSSTRIDFARGRAPPESKGLARKFRSSTESLWQDSKLDESRGASAERLPSPATPGTSPSGSSVVLASATEPLRQTRFGQTGRSDGTAQQEMTLDQVFQYALANNPILRARQSEVEIARARLVTAGLLNNPQFVLDTDAPTDAGDRVDMTTRLIFTIPTAGKIRHRQAVAEEGIRRSQIALARQSELVLLEAADAAHQVLYLQQLLALRRQLEEITAERAESVPTRLGVAPGQLNFVNKVEAEIDAVSARTQRIETSKDLAMARTRLARAIGLDPALSITMRGTLDVDPTPLLPLASWLEMARANNPRLADAQAAVAESQSQYVLARAESVPDLALGPRYQDELGVKEDRIGARINVDLPLFDRNQGGILQSAAQVRASCAMIRVVQLDSLHDVVAVHAELQSIQEAAQYYKTEVEAMIRRNQQLVEDPTVRGVIRVDEALEIRQDLLALELTYLQLRYRYNQLRSQLEVLLGEPITLEEELIRPPRPIAKVAARPL